MQIKSATAAAFLIILSTVICQGKTSRLNRLDQAVSKAHFEFSLDLYQTLGNCLQIISSLCKIVLLILLFLFLHFMNLKINK